jgi:hypothetical protein
MRLAVLVAAALLLSLPLEGEPVAEVRVDFSNPGLFPAQWTLVVHPDGSGHFHAEGGSKPTDESAMMLPVKVDRDIKLSAGYANKIFQTVRRHKLMRVGCESHMKVAFQGLKKISYSGPDGEGGCEFNYSKDKEIQELGESAVSVASTIIEGVRLELLLQHDPLGLDKEMEYVAEAAGDGRLQQICAIRGILQRLEDDPHVMDRVRKRAKNLLAHSDA